jgi:hypothetical protein
MQKESLLFLSFPSERALSKGTNKQAKAPYLAYLLSLAALHLKKTTVFLFTLQAYSYLCRRFGKSDASHAMRFAPMKTAVVARM